MKRVVVFLLFFLVSFSIAFTFEFTDYIIVDDYDGAFKAAKILNRPLVLIFGSSECHSCLSLKKDALTSPEVAKFFNDRFIVAFMHTDNTSKKGFYPSVFESSQALSFLEIAKKFDVQYLPTAIFLNSGYEVENRIDGYWDLDRFLTPLKFISQKYAKKANSIIEVTAEEASLLKKTMPFINVYSKEEFLKKNVFELDALDYFLITGASLRDIDVFSNSSKWLRNIILTPSEEDFQFLINESGTIIKDIKADEAFRIYEKKKNDPNFIVLDVRTPSEFVSEHIPGAINIDYQAIDFSSRMKTLDLSKTYFLYCRSGSRSAGAKSVMQKLGFLRIYHLLGGISSWKALNLPVER